MSKNLWVLIVFLLLMSCGKKSVILNKDEQIYKKIDSLIILSKNISFPDSLRSSYLSEAYKKIEQLKNDSLKTKSYIRTAYFNLVLGNLDKFGEISKKTLQITTVTKDTINLARAYSDLGYYYRQKYISDSSYFFFNKAYKIYKVLNNKLQVGKMLLSMATVQSDEKDYIGAEINTFKALSKLQNSKEYESLYLCYNTLGFVEKKLKRFDKSIEYRLKGEKYLSKILNSENYNILNLNGVGMVYQAKGDYKASIPYFEKALRTPNIFELYPKSYAMVLDNLAYAKFKFKITKDLPKSFIRALKIRDSLQIVDGIITSGLHLAEYYSSIKDTVKAIQYAENAKNLAKKSIINIDLMDSYLLLSKLQPSQKGINYLQQYIKLSDSLQESERLMREKFTRIAYETDEIIQEKEAESEKKWWLAGMLVVVISFSALIFMNMKQRSKNKELLFNKKQDEANVEIYNLMLAQQTKFQEGSNKEKERIAKELHDGILGRLFGTRLSLDSLNEGITDKEISEREEYIEEIQTIEEDIRKISHNLKTSLFNTNTSFRKLVEQLVTKQSKISNFEWSLNFNNLKNWENISNDIKINCYRILQESIQNINKYAKATEVKIEFYKEKQNLMLTIKDNGLGYNSKIKNKGIGQKNILSRVQTLNGKVEFISRVGFGTEIKIRIPI
ncbi:tetratricopeptide repeat-containing sensor histidine kinase [Lutibacter sp.]|uniref:tetratricopeptide repeat-containing sensor histidine kinase n=1 Tax=Lutibacter sp. TaxID=1925666 RepID=UPI0025C5694F|nr:tetratricopeptide repeat-containing sensor histidine kinase [Lutibacter sp.]MCF6182721.1 histidine kinase [Lutibacter sp.]